MWEAFALRRESIKEFPGREHRRDWINQIAQVPIARDQRLHAARAREHDQIVIAWVRREANDERWIPNNRREPPKQPNVCADLQLGYVLTELGPQQHALELQQQRGRDNELKVTP